MVSKVVNLALRGLEFFWTLLIMAIVGNVIAEAISGNPSIVNYNMFVAVFAMLSLIYLGAVAFNENFTGHAAIPLALDGFNVLLFFCGAVATAAYLGVHSCSNNEYTKLNSLTNGAFNRKKRCQELQATAAFLWFAFACFSASFFLSALNARGGGLTMRAGGGLRKGGPQMSQVA